MECHIDGVAYLLSLLGVGGMLWFMHSFMLQSLGNSLGQKVAHLEDALERAITELASLRQEDEESASDDKPHTE